MSAIDGIKKVWKSGALSRAAIAFSGLYLPRASSEYQANRTAALQKMESLRVEADEASQKVESLTKEVKELKQENLAKEQEITSLRHQNQVLESDVEKVEGSLKDAKGVADESTHHRGQNESLQRRLQLLEDEAEEADKNLRETNEKCAFPALEPSSGFMKRWKLTRHAAGSVKQISKPATTNARCKLFKGRSITGRRSTRRWRASTKRPKDSSRSSVVRLRVCEQMGTLTFSQCLYSLGRRRQGQL